MVSCTCKQGSHKTTKARADCLKSRGLLVSKGNRRIDAVIEKSNLTTQSNIEENIGEEEVKGAA